MELVGNRRVLVEEHRAEEEEAQNPQKDDDASQELEGPRYDRQIQVEGSLLGQASPGSLATMIFELQGSASNSPETLKQY